MNQIDTKTPTVMPRIKVILDQVDTWAFITKEMYQEFVYLLMELRNATAVTRFEIERAKAKNKTRKIEVWQDVKGLWTSDKAITEAHIERSIKENMVNEDEALAIDDAYCVMRETTIKSYQDFAFAMYQSIKSEDTQNKLANSAMSVDDIEL